MVSEKMATWPPQETDDVCQLLFGCHGILFVLRIISFSLLPALLTFCFSLLCEGERLIMVEIWLPAPLLAGDPRGCSVLFAVP